MVVPPLPFPGSYWVCPGRFLAGPYPGHGVVGIEGRRLDRLLDLGIRSFVNLLERGEGRGYARKYVDYRYRLAHLASRRGARVEIVELPIRDGGVVSRRKMRKLLDRIDRALAIGDGIYLHCWGGVGRTGMTVGCFLARHGIANGAAAMEAVARLRGVEAGAPGAVSAESERQRRFAAGWPRGL
ncbi:MAG TPA: hypothetical protein PK636_04740 [bacterium]|nr:hypothetical protein [bacterium]HPJ71968.1 hypothetical protein [bacterium]HPQ65245.1 hypothetical protein [bacterium]